MTGPSGQPTGAEAASEGPWWRRGVLYQIYPRSFADADGDGHGDLAGILAHLDHLADLGIDGIWLSPVTVSPNADWGYDVADFCAIEPQFGTMADLEKLISAAGDRGIRLLMDLVPNHTSNRHPWFVDARSARSARHRQWYVFCDGKDGGPPNNWVSTFGGPAWTLDERTGQYYLHNHLSEQPDLNWWNEEVRRAFDEILRFWLDKGVAGFRIDVCNGIVKDAELRDNPPATKDDDFEAQLFGQRAVYNLNRPEVHEVLRRWRALADTYGDDRLLIGETPVGLEELSAYYGHGDELHLAFNFPFLTSAFEPEALRGVVEATEALLPTGSWPVWTGSNHDMGRLASRWCAGRPERVRVALMMLLCLRGTPVLYQGDEIGLPDVEVPHEVMRDPLGVAYWPAYAGRDACRTPMPWNRGSGAGFTTPGVVPWLPIGDPSACNVEDQRDDEGSVLSLVRALIAVRQGSPDLIAGPYRTLPSPEGTWVFERGPSCVVALNFSDETIEVVAGSAPKGQGSEGVVLVSTDRRGERRPFSGRLSPWQGVVVHRARPDDVGPGPRP